MSLTQLGRYKITGTLGRGAMGVVYQAHDPLIEREVAIKAVSCGGLTREESEDFEQRFFREAKSAGRLNHPNIVTIHDVGRSGDLSYIAMEFLVGRSLRDILDSHVVLPVERIVQITANIADGLAFAHANDIVHRDIKPGNIMVLDSGLVKITDFGIALLPSSALTMVGTAMGTPKYMSPEQVIGRKADGRSDIFSLGAVLYEMLTGHPPFTGEDLNAILYQVLNTAPPLPTSVKPELPQGFDRIVARAMAKEPEKRYPNASEMAADLRNVHHVPGLMQKPPDADKPSPVETSSAFANSAEAGAAKLKAMQASAVSMANGRRRALRYGALFAVFALFGGWLLLRQVPVNSAKRIAADVSSPAPAAVAEIDSPKTDKPVVADEAMADKKTEAANARKARAEKLAAKARERDASAEEAKQTSAGDWHSALRADLRDCERKSFFRRILCGDKARRKYCPGHWDRVEECTVHTNSK